MKWLPIQERGDKQAAVLDLGLIRTEGAEERTHVIHSAVVHATKPACDLLVAAGPVTDGQVDLDAVDAQHRVEGDRAQALQLGLGVARSIPEPVLDALDHLVDARPLPRVEDVIEQGVPVLEVPVEAALGDAEHPRERLDPHRVRAAGGQCPQPPLQSRRCQGCG